MVGTRSLSKKKAVEASCSMCAQPDNNDMVQCDKCDAWFHFVCVGVDKDITNSDWFCNKCEGTTSGVVDDVNTAKELAEGNDVFQSPMNMGANGAEGVGITHRSVSPSMASSDSGKSRRERNIQLRRLEEEHKIKMSYIQQKYAIMSACNDSEESDDDDDVQLRLSQKIQGREANSQSVDRDVDPNIVNMSHQYGNVCQRQSDGIQRGEPVSQIQTCGPLGQDQIYARQITPRELPVFSGKSEEWPLFISCYENSTRICGFSNDENLLRLQRALKGRALEYVGSKLTLPALVPQVISTLRMLFGRPENIIQNLITKLRAGPNVNMGKLETLVHFSLDVKNIVATMEAANLTAHLCNPMLIQEFIEKLPTQMRLDWAIHARGLEVTDLTQFSNWLFNLAEAASSVVINSTTSTFDNEKRRPPRVNIHEERTGYDNNKSKNSSEFRCYGCDGKNHFISQCVKFKQLEHQKKWAIVNEKKLCRSCLRIHHPRTCRSRKECAIDGCTAKHHPLLHKLNVANENGDSNSVVAIHRTRTSNVLYRIVPIKLYGNNTSVNEYAFLDEGSGPTLIEKSVLEVLDIRGVQSELCLKWTDGTIHTEDKSETVDINISSTRKSDKRYLLKHVRSINKLDLPKQTLVFSELTGKFKHLRGLPVESYKCVTPKIIIGLNNRAVAMPLKAREGMAHEPAALKTRLGWTVYGTIDQEGSESTGYSNTSLQLHVCECDDNVALNKLMKYSMKLENEGVTARASGIDDDSKIINHVRQTGDKFTVKLLWKFKNIVLPNNYEMALRRLLCFERRLARDSFLEKRINEHIEDMLQKKYIRKLEKEEIEKYYPRKWYLPIFAVRNANKPDKIRLVWDAAAEYKGVSLNSFIDKGPDLVAPLLNVLFNFRVGKVGISGDIAEMFHRVAVDADDVQSQRFLWRQKGDGKPDVYVLQVMSFGASCSPSLAQCVKNCNAKRFIEECPRAVKSIVERHYVDDMLDSAETVTEAIQLAQQVKQIHMAGNFCIRNWMSNSKEVLVAMGESRHESKSFLPASRKIDYVVEPEKVLGMWWQTDDDVFTYDLRFTKATDEILSGKKLPTKRELLRLLMSIFDPMGLLSFYTVQMKILLQKVWRSNVEWDEDIPELFSDEWFRWLSVLRGVEGVRVPRCYFPNEVNKNSTIQLHIFVDAGENAYAAVAYFRVQTVGKITTALVCSKTKVAPIRPVSIPRMELMAAVLGVRLAKIIVDGHDLKIESTHFWTDSKTVLHWLQDDPRRYKQFVMYRVAEIQENSESSQWSYVPSKENVADLATKWARQPNFSSEGTWFIGPSFLCQTPEDWPRLPVCFNKTGAGYDVQLVSAQVQQNSSIIEYTRFSKWERLLRSTAYVKRFIDEKVFHRKVDSGINLSVDQLKWSQNFLIRFIQAQAYSKEIILLERDKAANMSKTSDLRKLSPFLDENKILRLRGRLERATVIHDETKNPIILPRSHYITKLIVDWYHRRFKHIHHETAINEIFRKYHISGLRTLLRTVRSGCQFSKNELAEPHPPEMGNLPVGRVAAFARPFSYVGIDFFGPFMVTVGRRSEKRYGAVFTCLTVRAVHIELVYSLNVSSCVMAVRNFIARRGAPLHVYSDNGTNLRAAEKELRLAYLEVDFASMQNEFATENIKWTFIPPASPHMGGAWERMVRSIKTVLYRIVTPDQKLNDEKLYNLFSEVENIVNSRPLTYLSLDSADQEALTPNHFLLGTSSGDKPTGRFEDNDRYLRKSWRHAQLLTDMFWKRWVAEVLPTMTRRTKWFDRVKPIEVGDVVIVVDSNLPRHCWPKGIVEEVVKGRDCQVRSAVVRTADGVYHRPAAKIAVMDVNREK